MTSTTVATRFCEGCLLDLPLDHFRRRSRDTGARMHKCNRCHATAERERRRLRRSKTVGKKLDWFARSIKRAKDDDTVITLTGRMVEACGGLERLVHTWAEHWRSAPPGSRRIFDSMEVIVRLSHYCEAARQRQLQRYSDEELDIVIRHHMDKYIAENPAVAIQAAQRLGWRVEPQ